MVEIKNALISSADSVAESILSGNVTAAEAIIVETIRPVMLCSVKDVSIRQIDSAAEALDFSGTTAVEDQKTMTEITVNLAQNLKDMIDRGAFEKKLPEHIKVNRKGKEAYQTIVGITAILTDMVAPMLEVIILLLPDIITLLQNIFGESNEEKVKRRYINNIVPQICNKIYPQVQQSIETSTNQALNEYQKMVDEKLTQINNSITAVETKKRKKIESYESYKKHVNEDLSFIQNIIQEMR